MPQSALSETAAEPPRIEDLLAAATRTIAAVRYCWAVSAAVEGGANARIVLPFADGDDEWTRWFLTKRASRKAVEIGAAGRLTLAYQHDPSEAYVVLAGPALMVEDEAVLRRFWKPGWDAFFPAGFAAAQMVPVRVAVERIEIHARGVTAEPFGFGRTVIERGADAVWRLAA